MTYDELVRFAAEKLNVEIEAVKERRYFEPTYPPDSTIASSAFSYQEIMTHYVVKGTKDRFDLTSPELFLKGLEVCPYEVTINKDRVRNGMSSLPNTIELWSPGMGAEKSVRQIADIPLTFWQCWAELEGGQG